jgi:hypothetical protein
MDLYPVQQTLCQHELFQGRRLCPMENTHSQGNRAPLGCVLAGVQHTGSGSKDCANIT